MAAHRLILAAAAVMCAACFGPAVHTDSFASMAEARQRGAVERGWVPGILPEGAYELRAAYQPEGAKRWGILNFRPADAGALRSVLEEDQVSVAGTRVEIPARIEWWPIALRDALDADQIAATGLRTYRSRSGGLVFAVNWNQGRAYYWTAAPQ